MTLRKAALILLAVSLGTCNQAIMVAPPGSVFSPPTLIANPEFITAHGDVSVISGLLVKANGDPVPDGTVVQFFTNLGKIDEQGKTNDGVVRVNLVSDSRSGKATVTAVSGGGGGSTTTPSPSPSPAGEAPPAAGFVSASSVTGASAVSAAQATATVTVTIGSALPALVLVSADRPRITTGGATRILARVFDASGNPIANVPVVFTLTIVGAVAQLDSRGEAVFTDNDGRATDTLRTNSLLNGTATVTATTPNGKSGQVSVAIN